MSVVYHLHFGWGFGRQHRPLARDHLDGGVRRGGALVAGGGLLVLLAPRAASTRGFNVAPGFTASSQMLFVSGAF